MIEYRERPPLENETLHRLFSASWDVHDRRDFVRSSAVPSFTWLHMRTIGWLAS